MKSPAAKATEQEFDTWLKERAVEWARLRSIKPPNVFVQIDAHSKQNLLAGFVNLDFLDTKLTREISDWLKNHAPTWTVTFGIGFEDDDLVVTATEVRLPKRVNSVVLETYLSRQRRVCRLIRWEMDHFPPEKWSRTRREFEEREPELRKLMDGGSDSNG